MDSSLFQSNFIKSNRIVYTPSAFAKSNLIYLQEVGTLQYLSPHTSRREKLDSFLFFLVLEGSGTVQYHNSTYPVRANDCIFLDCHNPYAHQSSDELWKLAWVHFTGPNMKAIYEKFLERSGSPIFRPQSPDVYRQIHREIFSIAASDDYIRDMRLMQELASLLEHVMEDGWKTGRHIKHSKSREELVLIKEYLDSNYQDKITLDQLAQRFYINKYHLARIFKEQYALSINRYLIQTRISHAKQLLRFTQLPVEEVGRQCGIEDPNYFSRIFRKVEGMSPAQFRKEWTPKKE